MKSRLAIWCLVLAMSHAGMYLVPSLRPGSSESRVADAATKYYERSNEKVPLSAETAKEHREARARILGEWKAGSQQVGMDDYVQQKILLAGGDIELLLRDEVDPFRQALASAWARCEIEPLNPEDGARRLAELPPDLIPRIVLSLLESGFEGDATMGIRDVSRTIAALDGQGLWAGVDSEAVSRAVEGEVMMRISPWEEWEEVADALARIPWDDLREKTFKVLALMHALPVELLAEKVSVLSPGDRDAYLGGLIRWSDEGSPLRNEAMRLLSDKARSEIDAGDTGSTD